MEDVNSSNQLKQEAAKALLALGALGFGVGAGTRGLTGLSNLFGRTQAPPRRPSYHKSLLQIPVGEEEAEEEKDQSIFKFGADQLASMLKQSYNDMRATDDEDREAKQHSEVFQGDIVGDGIDDIVDGHDTADPGACEKGEKQAEGEERKGLVDWLSNAIASPFYENAPRGNQLMGDLATSIWGNPWAVAGSVPAAGAGLYGGYKLMDWLADSRRKSELDSELEQAYAEYEDALQQPRQLKQSSVGPTLDELFDDFDGVEKSAENDLVSTVLSPFTNTMNRVVGPDATGGAMGAYLLAALLTGGTTGALSYDWAKKRQKQKLLEKAIKKREREQARRGPTPFVAVPVHGS
jgi:hypothetical protein